jgi:hypothetical protein
MSQTEQCLGVAYICVEKWGKIPNGFLCGWITGEKVGIIRVALLKNMSIICLVWRSRWPEENL